MGIEIRSKSQGTSGGCLVISTEDIEVLQQQHEQLAADKVA